MSERAPHFVLLLVALLLLAAMAAQVKRGQSDTALGKTLRTATAPVYQGVGAATGGARSAWDNYVNLLAARRERDQLQERLQRVESRERQAAELEQENRRLRELLELKRSPGLATARAAHVIETISAGPVRNALRIDLGGGDGIGLGWVAIDRGRLVGRVTKFDAHSAELITVLDPDSGIGVRHQLDRYAGVMRGGNHGPGSLTRLEYVPRDSQIAVGDPLVTSGLDGVYPPGLLVGFVRELELSSLLTWSVLVEPAVEPSSVEEVLLLPPPTSGGAK